MLMLNVDGADTCIGCISVCTDIKSGELKLASAGGATAYFKNNGEIMLNGLIITKDGRIIEGSGGSSQ